MKKLNKEQKEALLAAIDKLNDVEQNINVDSKKDIQEIVKTVSTILKQNNNEKNKLVKSSEEIEDSADYEYNLTLKDAAQKAININNELININLVLSELDNNEKHIKLYVRTVQMLLLNYHSYYSLIK